MSVRDSSSTPQSGVLPALGWACYLGSSWTWVIGMFFPVLLVRDYGFWGWVVFAVPNVVGAAAMGWVLTPERSLRVVREHRAFCEFFSRWTIALHAFALPWLTLSVFEWDPQHTSSGIALVALVLILVAWLCQRSMRTLWTVILAITVLSWIAFAWYSQQKLFATDFTFAPPSPWTRLNWVDLLCFVPASLTGFLLCPYLDSTFHHARQETDVATGRAAFTLGFGVVFLSMIVFALTYAVQAESGLYNRPRDFLVLMVLVAVFVLPQGALTVGLHLRELWQDMGVKVRVGDVVIIVVALMLGVLLRGGFAWPNSPIDSGEGIYRCFLMFYGVVFPGYVWLCMIPTWAEAREKIAARRRLADGRLRLSSDGGMLSRKRLARKRWIWAIAVIIALPMAFEGFVVGRSWWMIWSLCVLVAARGVVETMSFKSKPSPPKQVAAAKQNLTSRVS